MTALEVTVFSRAGCHLCDRTLDEIRGIVGDGEGVVLEIRGEGEKAEVTVRFRDKGTKHLALAWAPLKKIG